MRFLNSISPDERVQNLLNSCNGLEGLEELINEILELKVSGIYEKFYTTSRLNKKILRLKPGLTENEQQILIIKYGKEKLSDLFYFPPITGLINLNNFYTMYKFLEAFYRMNNEGELNDKNLKDLYFSGLDRRIIFTLNNFDENLETPQLNPNFFHKIKKIKWKNNDSKQLFKELNEIIRDILGKTHNHRFTNSQMFHGLEYIFILLLAACSAVNNGRDKINMEDILIAYKTYFKLLKTDLTSLVDRLGEMNKSEVEKH